MFLTFAFLCSHVSADCSSIIKGNQTIIKTETIFKADIAILIDESGSILDSDYTKEIDFCKSLVNSFNVNENEVRFALIWFASNGMMELDWYRGDNKSSVINVLQSKKHNNGYDTRFDPPLKIVQNLVGDRQHPKFRPDAVKIVVLITDGDNSDQGETRKTTKALRDSGVVIFAIRVGAASVQPHLVEITGGNANQVFATEDFNHLKTKLEGLKTEIKNHHVCEFHYEPTCNCYYDKSKNCVQEGYLKITRVDTPIARDACPKDKTKSLPCDQAMCDQTKPNTIKPAQITSNTIKPSDQTTPNKGSGIMKSGCFILYLLVTIRIIYI